MDHIKPDFFERMTWDRTIPDEPKDPRDRCPVCGHPGYAMPSGDDGFGNPRRTYFWCDRCDRMTWEG